MTDTELEAQFTEIKELIGKSHDHVTNQVTLVGNRLGVRIDVLTDQVKVIAEGHGVLLGHIEDMKQGIGRLESCQQRFDLRMLSAESRLTSVESRLSGVEGRVIGVERIQHVVLTEVRGLAATVEKLASPR